MTEMTYTTHTNIPENPKLKKPLRNIPTANSVFGLLLSIATPTKKEETEYPVCCSTIIAAVEINNTNNEHFLVEFQLTNVIKRR